MSSGRHYTRAPADADHRYAPRADPAPHHHPAPVPHASHHGSSRYASQHGPTASTRSPPREDRYSNASCGSVAGPSNGATSPIASRYPSDPSRRHQESQYDARSDSRRPAVPSAEESRHRTGTGSAGSSAAAPPPTGPKFAAQPQLDRRMNFVDRGAYADLDPPAAQPLPVRDPPPPPREQAPVLHSGRGHYARASYQRGPPPNPPPAAPGGLQGEPRRETWERRPNAPGAYYVQPNQGFGYGASAYNSNTAGRPPPPVRPPSPSPRESSSSKRDSTARSHRLSPSRSPPSSSPRSSASSRSPSPKRRKSGASTSRRGISISRSPRSPSSGSSMERGGPSGRKPSKYDDGRARENRGRGGESSDEDDRRKRGRSAERERGGRLEKKQKTAATYERKEIPPSREVPAPRGMGGAVPTGPAADRFGAGGQRPQGGRPPAAAYERPFYPTHGSRGAPHLAHPPSHLQPPPFQQQHHSVPPPRPQPPPPQPQPTSRANAIPPPRPTPSPALAVSGPPTGTPTGPRALREKSSVAPTGPSALRDARDKFAAPAEIPKGPKQKIVPLKTTPKIIAVPTGPRVLASNVKKFFPGDDDEEDAASAAAKARALPLLPPPTGPVTETERRDPRPSSSMDVDVARRRDNDDRDRERERPRDGARWSDERRLDDRRPRDRMDGDERGRDRELTAEEREAWARYDAQQLAANGEGDRRENGYGRERYTSRREEDEYRREGARDPQGYAAPSSSRDSRYAYDRPPYTDSRPSSRTDDSRYPPTPTGPSSAAQSPVPNRYALDPRDVRDPRWADSLAADPHDAYPPPTSPRHSTAYPPSYPDSRPSSVYDDRPARELRDPRDPRDPRDVRRSDPRDLEVAGGPPSISDPSPMILESRPTSLAGTAANSRRGSPFPNNETAAFPPPPPGTTELYERLVQVGEGTYGKVYKARNVETNVLVAMKRIRMEAEKDGFPVTAIREIKLLQSLRHPNVVDLVEMMVSKGHVYMVFEYIHHDLTGVLHHPTITFTPAHLKSLMKQFLEGLGFIHRRGVLHRDLKGSNILIGRNGELKIADFGLARFYARGRKNDYTNRVITQWYKPPELLFGATVYGAEVDMWSAGCIFLELFARRPVFQGQDEIHQLDVIFKAIGTPNVETWPSLIDLPWYELVKPQAAIESKLRETFSKWLTPAGLDLAEALLSLNPANRPDADAALRMPYFTKEAPRPEMPDVLREVKGEWHEYESKLARKKHRG